MKIFQNKTKKIEKNVQGLISFVYIEYLKKMQNSGSFMNYKPFFPKNLLRTN